ncbi:hypothetical protein ACOSP7_007563 [Xanthoceras sorbifolium]
MLAKLKAIQLASANGWRWLWMETDSMIVYSYLSSSNFTPPWELWNLWLHCKDLVSRMQRLSLFYDILASEGFKVSGYVWWETPPSCIVRQLHLDSWGVLGFRFR